MSSIRSRLKWNNARISSLNRNTQQGLVIMAYDIANKAKGNAPYLSGALVNSIRVQPKQNSVDVVAGGTFGGKRIKYAKKREYVNNLHPSTRFYMKRALNSAMQGDWQQRYFGRVTK